jgi:drug/metabolite transporter (DMT)-like permease
LSGIALALVALAGLSANVMVARVGGARVPINAGYLVAVVVNVLFAALLLAAELATRPQPLQWSAKGTLLFALAGFFSTYLGRWFMYESVARLGPARTSAFQVSSPLFTFLIALAFLGEALTAQALAGMVATALGLLLISLRGARVSPVAGNARLRQSWLRSAWLVGFASSAAYAVGNVMRGAGVRAWDEPIAGALIGAVAGIACHFAFTSERRQMLRGLRAAHRGGLALFALSGVLTIVAQVCTIAAMKLAPVAIVALITLCTPLLVFPMSYFFLGNDEGINARTLVGAALSLSGIAMILLH